VAVVFRIAYLLVSSNVNKVFIGAFLFIWTITSVLTLKFTYETNWITQDEILSKKVYDYFSVNINKYSGKSIVFVDTKEDIVLPWSPTSLVKTALSTNNFLMSITQILLKA